MTNLTKICNTSLMETLPMSEAHISGKYSSATDTRNVLASSVFVHVFSIILKQFQVLYSIVQLIVVDVMHNLIAFKIPTYRIFHHKTMFRHVPVSHFVPKRMVFGKYIFVSSTINIGAPLPPSTFFPTHDRLLPLVSTFFRTGLASSLPKLPFHYLKGFITNTANRFDILHIRTVYPNLATI